MHMFKFLIVFAEQATIGFAKPGFKENFCFFNKKKKKKIQFHIIGYFLKPLNMLDVYLSYT